jgi:hypothetical protein
MNVACSTYGERRGTYRILVGKHERKRPLRKPRRKWEDIIMMCLQEMEWGMDWINVTEDRERWRALVNVIMNLRVP